MKDINFLKENGIDVDSGVEILGDVDMYNDTLKDFIEVSEDRLPELEKYKNSSDMENYAICVHAMKGDSKYLGFTKLAELSLEHQLRSQEGDIEFVNNNYNELINEANRIVSVVKKYLENLFYEIFRKMFSNDTNYGVTL